MESDQIEIMNGDELSNQLDVVCDLLSSQKFLLVTLDPKTMTTTCVGSQLGLQFLHHKPSHDKDVRNVSALLKQFLSDYYKTREITVLERLLPDNSHDSSADKNCEAKDQRNNRNTKNCKEQSKKEVNDNSVLDRGSKRKADKTTSSIYQNKKLSRSGRKIKIPKWLQNSKELETSVSEMEDIETPVSSQENDAEFPCSICGKRFRMEKYVRHHKVEVHKISRTAEKDHENLSDDLVISEEDKIPREIKRKCNTESKKGRQLTVESESHCGEKGSEVKFEKMKRDDENLEQEEQIVCENFGEIRDSSLVPKMEDGNINGSSDKEENIPDLEFNFQSQNIGNSKTETLSQIICNYWYCQQTFSKKSNLTRHLKRVHGEGAMKAKVQSSNIEAKRKEFRCGQCDEVMYSLKEKIRHELDVHDLVMLEKSDSDLSYKCPICKVSQQTMESIKRHIQDHFQTNLSELTCRICKVQCKSKNRLQNHMLIHGEAKFPCNICGKKFHMMKYVRPHIKKAHKKIFSEDAMASDDIDENVRMEESKQIKPRLQTPGICDVCGKSYTSLTSMLNHRTIHFEDRPYPCTKCNKKFRLQNSLRNHMMIHRDTKDYVCEHCGKSFKISQGLRMHRLRYHDKVDYKCEICDRKFLSFGGKKYHILREHKEVADSFGLKLYPCKYCSRRCASYQEYLKHESSHIDNRSHVCNLCDGRWATASQLNVHRKSHFGLNKRFHCKICQFKTSTPWKLKRHLASAKHIDNCLSAGHKSISVAATMENTDIVEKLNSEDGKIDTENDKTMKETSQVQGQTEVVSMETGEIISSPSQGQSSTEQLQVVEVKCCDTTENLVEGSQIFYTEQGGILYRIVEKGVELDGKTYIYDPSVNQAVESILKLQNS